MHRVTGWMLAALAAIGLLGLTSPAVARSSQDPDLTQGEWSIERHDQDPGKVQLRLHREWNIGSDHNNFSYSDDVARDELDISRGEWQADRAEVSFDWKR